MLLTPVKIERSKKDWQYIVLHHSWSPDNKTTSNWEGITAYHKSLGWSDVGYHFGFEYVDNVLVLRLGRSLEMSGAHTLEFNQNGIGICLIGNYDVQIPTVEQLNAIEELCKTLMKLYDISAKHIIGHHESYAIRNVPVAKSCPGILFPINRLRERLLQNGFSDNPTLTP